MMFGSPFLFFFQLLNNWPNSVLFLLRPTNITAVETVDIVVNKWTTEYAGTTRHVLSENEHQYGRVDFSVCGKNFCKDCEFHWEVLHKSTLTRTLTTSTCNATVTQLRNGEYSVFVTGRRNDSIVLVGEVWFDLKRRWLAAIGDSFISGEGNPNSNASWIHSECHRSETSFALQSFRRLQRSDNLYEISFLACSGATISSLIRNQLGPLQILAAQRGHGPDLLVLSIGANDLGFGEIIHAIQHGGMPKILSMLEIRLLSLSSELNRLANAIRLLSPKKVVLSLYYGIGTDSRGQPLGGCSGYEKVSTKDLRLTESRILSQLNKILLLKAKEQGWKVLDPRNIFVSHGICSSDSWIRSPLESVRLQGNTGGAFHPNQIAHANVSFLFDSLLKDI